MTRLYPDTTISENFMAPFEKVAIWSFLSRTLPGLAGRAYKAVSPSNLSLAFTPSTRGIEQGIGMGARAVLNPQRADQVTRLMRGVPRNAVREAISGSLIGGLLEGGIGAATAEDGQGSSAFLHGLGSGAAAGALWGGLAGTAGGIVRNARGLNRSALAARNNIPRPVMAKKVNEMGTWDALKGSFSGKDTLDRQIARHKTIGGASQLGAEMALPMVAMPYIAPEPEAPPPPPPIPKPPSFAANTPAVYSQPQNFKGGSVASRLKPIDFTKIPSYHR